jgi:hypothetical protein
MPKPLRGFLRRPYATVLLAKVGIATRDWDLLRRAYAMQKLSRDCFGWTTSQPTRWWEYPWILREVERRLDGRLRTAVDAGAGRSPMPLALARLGLETTVVDPDSQKRTGRHVGGEWEWVNYQQWDVKTRCAGIEEEVFEPDSLGFVVSVSVIEHIPRAIRLEGLRRIATALEPRGVFVLTLDLIRSTMHLWNRVLNEEVEPPAVHGTVEDFIREAEACGLELQQQESCPISTDRIDVLGLVFRKGNPSGRYGFRTPTPMVVPFGSSAPFQGDVEAYQTRRRKCGRSMLMRTSLAIVFSPFLSQPREPTQPKSQTSF